MPRTQRALTRWEESCRRMDVPALLRIEVRIVCSCGQLQDAEGLGEAACRGCGRLFAPDNRDHTRAEVEAMTRAKAQATRC